MFEQSRVVWCVVALAMSLSAGTCKMKTVCNCGLAGKKISVNQGSKSTAVLANF